MILPILTRIRKETVDGAPDVLDGLMYHNYWQLEKSPFATSPQKMEDFFVGQSHEEILARLDYLTTTGRRLGLVTGVSGVGKSALVDHVMRRLQALGKQAVTVRLMGVDADEFAQSLCDALRLRTGKARSVATLWQALFDHLTVNRFQHVDSVILLDDIDEAEEDVLRSVSRLAQWQPTCESKLTMIATCRGDRVDLVGRRLLELCDLHMELPTWTLEETSKYLKQALSQVGRTLPAFDVRAVEAIHRRSGGRIRVIRQLAELSLLAGASGERTTVDPETVAAVDHELRPGSQLTEVMI